MRHRLSARICVWAYDLGHVGAGRHWIRAIPRSLGRILERIVRHSAVGVVELVVYHRRLYRSRISNDTQRYTELIACHRKPSGVFSHGQIHWPTALLQEVSVSKARPRTSLFYLQEVCVEDGPPLPVASNMCRVSKLQSVPALPHIRDGLLLGLLH